MARRVEEAHYHCNVVHRTGHSHTNWLMNAADELEDDQHILPRVRRTAQLPEADVQSLRWIRRQSARLPGERHRMIMLCINVSAREMARRSAEREALLCEESRRQGRSKCKSTRDRTRGSSDRPRRGR